MKIRLSQEQIALVKMGTGVVVGNDTYYYFPFWFKQTNLKDSKFDRKEFEIISFENLPKELIDKIDVVRHTTIIRPSKLNFEKTKGDE